jgi:hypothetical protein
MSKKAEILSKAIGANRFKRKEVIINPALESLKLENIALKDQILKLKNDLKERDAEIKKMKSPSKNTKTSSQNKKDSSVSDELILYKFKELQAVGSINMFRAIKEESQIQNTDTPTITRTTFEDPYRVNGASIVKSRKALESHGFIRTIRDHHRKTRYQIIKDLPILNTSTQS